MVSSESLEYCKWQIPDGFHIRLNLLQEEDLELLHSWKSQIDISYLTSKAIEYISLEEQQQQFRQKRPSIFAIRRITDGQLLVQIRIYNINPKNRTVAIGYFTGANYRRLGYTKEALCLLINYLFKVVGLNKVMADTGAFNQASIALLKSLGFKQDGCLRQHQLLDGILHDQLLFSLLALEWKKDCRLLETKM
ncbi:GNAT family N-acetyltransferase [Nostoc sp. LEGE 12450]|uniref:GNAT family N-acetyltransferase n=1 Tax=Nostoc sp. LEGE 12450 TaxID=1828643 RepID=UPI001881FC2D|nr:GNAT family protein [Nostoc sp. LEGE 12450]MBE8992208.1 GNAT family N-acetyltransferase [Nostoc sp. LEGE 12450]